MSVTPEQARAVALHHIRRYVERGDTYESLKEGQMGSYNNEYRAVIGSFGVPDCRAPKRLGPDAITVARAAGQDCCYHFSLQALYDELLSGTRQLSMFEASP